MSSSDRLDLEALAFSHDASSEGLPSIDEIVSSLSQLRGDLGHLFDLKSDEDQVVSSLFRVLMKLTQLLQWAPVEPSILPVELGAVESAHVTPEGTLIFFRNDGEIGTLDLSEFDNRDVLVEVVRDLTPKLKDILENPPKVEEPVIEEPEPEPEPVLEEPVTEDEAEAEEPIVEEPPVMDEPVIEREPEEQIVEEPPEPLIPELPPVEKTVERPPVKKKKRKPKLKMRKPRARKVDLLWAILRGQRGDSLQEILEYRANREEEERELLDDLKKHQVLKLEGQDGFVDRLKKVFKRSREKKQ